MADYADNPDATFWKTLKAGNDLFEKSLLPPKVTVCQNRYRFEPGDKGTTGDNPIENRCPAVNAKS